MCINKPRTHLFFLFISLVTFIYPLPLTFSVDSIDFGNIAINTPTNASVTITNIYNLPQEITINSYIPEVTILNNSILLQTEESQTVNISFTGRTNILYQSAIIFQNQYNHTPNYLPVTAQCNLPNNEYPSTYNLYDNNLKEALLALVNNHTSLGYDTGRNTMYQVVDNVGGYVECVYTGQQFTSGNIAHMTSQGMDCEHTWPQSLGATGTAKSDLHHLFPTASVANNARGNLPFGVVVNPNWEMNGTKRGTNSSGVAVYEPRDAQKGVTARAMMYFAIRYSNPYAPFFNNQEAVLKQWNANFPVGTHENDRNNAIAGYQGKKNPFIVHPYFAQRIYSISTTATAPIAYNLVYPDLVKYDGAGQLNIAVFNNGNANITVTSASLNHPNYQVLGYPTSITQSQIANITLNITQPLQQLVVLTLQTNAGSFAINLQHSGLDTMQNDTVEAALWKPSVYPNPVRGSLNVKTNLLKGYVTVSIFNLKGQKVKETVLRGEEMKVEMPQTTPSGIYFIRLSQENNVRTKKILYLKAG